MKKTKPSILIVGGSGYIGSSLARAFCSDHTVTCTYHREVTRERNITYLPFSRLSEKDACKNLVVRLEPEYIFYCAGSNDLSVSELDSNLKMVQMVHSIGASNFLTAADSVKARLVYISSDYIFSGVDGNFDEAHSASPAFQLGKVKVSAENYIRSRSLNYLIVRCAPLLGRGTLDHPSWIDRLRQAALLGKKTRLPTMNVHNPVHVSFLVEVLRNALKNDLKNKTLHVGGLSKVSMFECAQIFAQFMKLDPALIEASDADSHAVPGDYSLNFSETLKMVGVSPLLLEQSLDLLK